jgi:hypothetical protein
MDLAQLNTELQQAGERLIAALTHEREARGGNRAGIWMTSQYSLRAARRHVEQSAQSYAIALRTYRVAMLSELAPLEMAQSGILGRISAHYERASATATPFGSGRARPCRPRRKEPLRNR